MNTAATIRVVAACIQLDDLESWHLLGPRIYAAKEAVRGRGGITPAELAVLEGYAERWCNLRADLRAFYRALCCTNTTASVSLWKILHGGAPLEGWQENVLAQLWEDAIGYRPCVDLCPRRRTG